MTPGHGGVSCGRRTRCIACHKVQSFLAWLSSLAAISCYSYLSTWFLYCWQYWERIPKLLRCVTFSVRYTNIIERTNIFQSYLKRANWSPLAPKQTGLFWVWSSEGGKHSRNSPGPFGEQEFHVKRLIRKSLVDITTISKNVKRKRTIK